MNKKFTLEYWQDEGWYVGKLREFPGVMSQGETYEALIENIKDAFKLMMDEENKEGREVHTTELEIAI